MSNQRDYEFFNLRKGARAFISKVFSFGGNSTERLRYVNIVFEDNDSVQVGEIEGAICLRLSGKVRKTQVTALVSQDDKKVRRLSLQTFKTRKGEWGTFGP